MSLALSLPFSNPSLSSPTYHHQRRLILKSPKSSSSSRISIPTPTHDPSPPHIQKTGVIIIGAGLSGLAAATRLASENIPFLLLDASDAVGGRVRTDSLDGFLLDRGFQIFITSYPEAQSLLDYQSLHLNKFYSGAKIFHGGRFHTVSDPLRHFSDSLRSLTNPIGSLLDKLLIAFTRLRVLTRSDQDILSSEEVSTAELLTRTGFSDSVVDRFFRPFFGGIFFDKELETTSRLFNFVLKCLAVGENTLPAKGISAIPEQLAGKLPAESIRLNSRAVSVEVGSGSASVGLESGERLRCEMGVIVAVEEPEAVKLLAGNLNRKKPVQKPDRSTVCLYFSAEPGQVPDRDPILFLNGSGKGIVNNMFFATNVAPSYGPPGKALVSVSLIGLFEGVGDEHLRAEVVRELSGWFGESVVGSWKHLRTYRIQFAQPNQSPPTDLMKNPRVRPGLYLCGDYQTSATFDGALVSGRKAVEALLRDRALIQV